MVGNITHMERGMSLYPHQKEKERTVQQTKLSTPSTSLKTVSLPAQSVDESHNMLEKNFASTGHDESRYLSALKNNFYTEQDMTLSMKRNEIIAISEAIAEMGNWHGNKSMQRAKLMKDLTEPDEKNLKAIREHIKEKAQESQQPAEQSAVSEETKTETKYDTVTKQRETVSTPEEGASAPAPNTQPESAMSEAAAPTPEITHPKDIVIKPSIDIVV